MQQIFERFRRFTATHVAGVRVHAYVIPYGESKENKLLSAIRDSNIYFFCEGEDDLYVMNMKFHSTSDVPSSMETGLKVQGQFHC